MIMNFGGEISRSLKLHWRALKCNIHMAQKKMKNLPPIPREKKLICLHEETLGMTETNKHNFDS